MSAEHSVVPEIPFIQDHQFRYGEIETVAPGIRRLTARNAGPFTYHGTGTYIVGQGEVAVIDPGPDDPNHIDTLVSSLSSETISHILVTHCHRDHSPGARLLQAACDAPTYAFGPHAGGIEHDDSAIEEGVDTLFTPDNPITHGEYLTVGDCEIECIHTPGHTSNHMCFSVPKQDSLFSGDHVMGPYQQPHVFFCSQTGFAVQRRSRYGMVHQRSYPTRRQHGRLPGQSGPALQPN